MSVDAPDRELVAAADPEARDYLRKADPMLERLIDGAAGLPSASLDG